MLEEKNANQMESSAWQEWKKKYTQNDRIEFINFVDLFSHVRQR